MHSCIYEGQVKHRRFSPRQHEFNYKLFMVFIDLDELDDVFKRRWLWSNKAIAPVRLKRCDYIGDESVSIAEAVKEKVFQQTGEKVTGTIRMLTHLRYFGYVFNPVTFYYCYNSENKTVDYIVAEITNTPWKERHSYVLKTKDDNFNFNFDKDFHVSPFLPMDMKYFWGFTSPDDNLTVYMKNTKDDEKIFDASLNMQRKEMSSYQCARVLIVYPLMTVKVIAGIYWQALKLYLKKVPVVDHVNKDDLNTEKRLYRG